MRFLRLPAIVTLISVTSCSQHAPYAVSELNVNRSNWDTVRVEVAFARLSVLGSATPVPRPPVTVYLFDSAFDTLYSGSDLTVPVPDRTQGNGEPLLVEVCGHFDRLDVCEQRGLLASPKRIRASHDLQYPRGGDVEQGEYSVDFVVERMAWQDTLWQEVEPSAVTGYWRVYVDGHEEESVRIPMTRKRSRFNLSGLDNYRDFSYYLRSALLERNEALVRFDLYAGFGGDETRVADAESVIRKKPREIREQEAGYFVEQASVEILRRLTSFFGPSRTYVYLDSWQFVESERQYLIEMEITWGSTFLRRRWYRISGILEVSEDGSDARFRLRRANDRGADRWRDRVDGDELRLRPLQPRPEADASRQDDSGG